MLLSAVSTCMRVGHSMYKAKAPAMCTSFIDPSGNSAATKPGRKTQAS